MTNQKQRNRHEAGKGLLRLLVGVVMGATLAQALNYTGLVLVCIIAILVVAAATPEEVEA